MNGNFTSTPLEDIIGEIRRKCDLCYLDNAAMSLPLGQVVEAVHSFHVMRQEKGPDFLTWWKRTDDLRSLIARKIGGDSDEIAILHNTSMGVNLAANAIPFAPGDNVIITDSEFPSNAYPWFNLEARGVEVRVVANKNGRFRLEDFASAIDKHTKAVSVSWVMAGTGAVVDIKKLGALCKDLGVIFVVDAIQGLGVLDFPKGCADIVVSGFYKWLQGTDGLAFAYVKRELYPYLKVPFAGFAGVKEKFNYDGYHFELVEEARRFETGNMNFSGIHGSAVAMELLENHQMEITNRVQGLTRLVRKKASEKGLTVFTPEEEPISGITLLTGTGLTAKQLREKGIIVNERKGIRISPNYYNNEEDIERLFEVLT